MKTKKLLLLSLLFVAGTLSAQNYVYDYKPFYEKMGDDALTFKKMINGYKVYIKIKLEKYNNKGTTVCLSFHIDYR